MRAYSTRFTISTISCLWEPPNPKEVSRALAVALRVLEHLGVPAVVHKTEEPAYRITFLGILTQMLSSYDCWLAKSSIHRLPWGQSWQGQQICFHSDNMAVVGILNSRTANPLPLLHLLWCFLFYCAYYGFHFSCMHIQGAMKTAADALSRNNLTLFSSLIPQALQFSVPPPLFKLLITIRPDWGSPAWTQLFVRSLTGGRRIHSSLL